MRPILLAATLAVLAASAAKPVLAQAVGVNHSRGTAVTFGEDRQGYGRALLEGLMPGQIASWEAQGISTRIGTAQISVNNDRQPEFAVRLENPEQCDRYGCLTFVFMMIGRDWKPVLQTKTATLTVGELDRASGMALLLTDGASAWAWDGQSYDMAH